MLVSLRNCLIQRNKYEDKLEVVLKPHKNNEHQRGTVCITVLKVHNPVKLGNKTKQQVVVTDETDQAMIILWDSHINA